MASSLELFHISKYISVPLAAFAVWFLVVAKGGLPPASKKSSSSPASFYVTYIISGFLVKPMEGAALYSVRPVLLLDSRLHTYADRHGGRRHFAPWMQFYLQAAVVEKGVDAKEYPKSRIEVVVGCVMTSVIAFFVIVACAGAI